MLPLGPCRHYLTFKNEARKPQSGRERTHMRGRRAEICCVLVAVWAAVALPGVTLGEGPWWIRGAILLIVFCVFAAAYMAPILGKELLQDVRREFSVRAEGEWSVDSPLLTETTSLGDVAGVELEIQGGRVDTQDSLVLHNVKVVLAAALTVVYYPAILGLLGWLSDRIGAGFGVAGWWGAAMGGWVIGVTIYVMYEVANLVGHYFRVHRAAIRIAERLRKRLKSAGVSPDDSRDAAIRKYHEVAGIRNRAVARLRRTRPTFVIGFLSL